jgi:hypothetical protein
MRWNSEFIENIQNEQRQERESAPKTAKRQDNLLRLISKNLYGEKVHYALELIQNAEDCGSSYITFIFENDKIIVINDGDVFTSYDVEGICSVEPGRKKNKIGFFGVGFKLVFNVTKTPQIISSDFNFQIDNYICPKPSKDIPEDLLRYYNKDKGSIFILPQSEGLPTIPDFIENFKEIDEKILLFLNNVKELNFIDKVNNEQWSIEKPPSENSLISLKNGRTNQETKWRVFHKDLPVSSQEVLIPEEKKGIENTRIIIAFPSDEETREAIKGSTLYCYLPTKKRTDMPFLVQADFVPTVGRGNIQDIDWNKWLLKKLGELSAEAVDQIRGEVNLVKELYNLIPLKDEIHEPLMDILSNAMYESLKSKDIAKTLDSEWKKPHQCVIPISPKITDIILQNDLKHLFGKQLVYADVEFPERARPILNDLGSSILGETEFIEFLTKENLIKDRKPAWFLKAQAYLPEIFDVKDRNYKEEFRWSEEKKQLFAKLEATRFILTNQGNLVPLKDPKNPDRLICYPQSIDLSEVNELFTEGELVFLNRYFQSSTITKRKEADPEEEERREKVHEFFENIGVKIYFKQSHVIKDVILPKYSSGKYKNYDDLKQYKLLNYIRLYWPTLESEVKNKKLSEDIFDTISKTTLIKAYTYRNSEKIPCYMPPGTLYFTKRYGKTENIEDLYEGIEEIYYLHPYYLNREKHEEQKKRRGRQKPEYSWKKFFEMLGVWASPKVEREDKWISISGKKGYEWVEKKYSPSGIHELFGDSFSPDIQKLIEYCSHLKDTEAVTRRMTILFHSLSDNWKDYSNFCKTTYKYFYYSEQHVSYPYSSFLDYLRKARWVPTTDGDFAKPEEVFTDNKRNRYLLGNDSKFVNLPGNRTFLKDIGINLEPNIEQVIRHLKEYKTNNKDEKKRDLEKFQEIYSFISEKLKEHEGEENELTEVVSKEFDENELLYLPRKDRSWWKPGLVFWKDHSKIFGPLRGYIEYEGKELYHPDLKNFMSSLGVKERPSIKQAIEVLTELKSQNNIDALKRIAVRIYSYINDLLSHNHEEQVDWNEHTFLTRNGNFCKPMDIYFDDDEEYSKYFHDKAEFLYLPFSTGIKLSSFLKSGGFKSFSGNLTITKFLDDVTEVEGSEVSHVIKAINLVKAYLLNRNLEAYESLQSASAFGKPANLEIYETSKINISLFLKKNDSETLQITDIEKGIYYSDQENRLYIFRGTNIFSEKVAKEISRIFKGAENEVFPFLNSILPKAKDDEALEAQLRLFGIEEEAYASPEKVELLPKEEKPEKEEEVGSKEKKKEEQLQETPTVTPPSTPKLRKDIIEPNEYYPSTLKEYTPYQKTEGEAPKVTRVIHLKEGKPGFTSTTRNRTTRAGTTDAEETAIQMVINFENGEGRQGEDRHKQKGIGYDVYSKPPEGEERFIEVKHFGEQEGPFKLTPHESEKAKKEGDKYYVYVVTGLKEGTHPKKIFIIQNPTKWLTPDPPIEQQYSDWKNAVTKEYEFKKA